MDKLVGGDSVALDLLTYWNSGLNKSEYLEDASIKVENINGPVLLFSGKDDGVWPSADMANKIEQRLQVNNFSFSIQNIQYENAGHLISRNPENDSDTEERKGSMKLNGKKYSFDFGGTQEGDNQAKKDAKTQVFAFLERL
jgi:dienelactone hydrolase